MNWSHDIRLQFDAHLFKLFLVILLLSLGLLLLLLLLLLSLLLLGALLLLLLLQRLSGHISPPSVTLCDDLAADRRVSSSATQFKGELRYFKPGPYFWHEIRSSTHREQFGESRRPSEDI